MLNDDKVSIMSNVPEIQNLFYEFKLHYVG